MTWFKVRQDLLPIKAHFFFFFAAMGPLLPQMNVYGKQLGITPAIMGFVTSVLPILWALAKPAVGFLVDYFHSYRKFIFMFLIFSMSGSYFCLFFLPEPPNNYLVRPSNITVIRDFTQDNDSQSKWIKITPCDSDTTISNTCVNNSNLLLASCGWICKSQLMSLDDNTYNADNVMYFWIDKNDIETKQQYLTSLHYNSSRTVIERSCRQFNMDDFVELHVQNTTDDNTIKCVFKNDCKYLSCAFINDQIENINLTMGFDSGETVSVANDYNLYTTITFWGFVIFMCMGTVGYNVANCIGDAICFDVLGPDNAMKYGFQRAWGTAGYGFAALVSGLAVDHVSGDNPHKDFTPAFILMAVFTVIDLFFCRNLELPKMTRPVNAGSTLTGLFKKPPILLFLTFTVIVGIFDSFLIYYMFWFMEDLAEETGQYANIKFLEGLTIALESFGGEILFFSLSGKILKHLSFRNTLTIGLFFYGLRMYSISLITQPWHLVIVATFLQGPTYALCYATIVGYAAHIAPPGLSATLQGILAGMDDGVGFAIGSLIGGILYNMIGGRDSFRIMGIIGFASVLVYIVSNKFIPEYENTKVDEYGKGNISKDDEEGREMIDLSKKNGNSIEKPSTDNTVLKVDNVMENNENEG